MGLPDELIHFITNGSVFGLPTLAVMTIPLVLGIIVGFFAIKFLKIAVVIIIILAAVVYFGFYSLNIPALQQIAQQYGPDAVTFGSMLLGMLPLSIGFVIGVVIGVIVG